MPFTANGVPRVEVLPKSPGGWFANVLGQSAVPSTLASAERKLNSLSPDHKALLLLKHNGNTVEASRDEMAYVRLPFKIDLQY